ncbi:Catechol 2,3-dioxygenase [Oceanobacillus limi]|uniref:Catechol 2,3-dioxygenase n=1 Tax=Oceanobacillus limi TaxID=930131 RepID=A0A1I0B4A9_9BACI|nr:VOC family protein [Oceanobacillus limi]SET01709.1 Catechol 2,3-dioxygenase [Oceanobacillus limi]
MKKGLLHHVEMNVSNLQATVDFWGWLLNELGYDRFQSWEKGQSWRLNDTYIVFVQVEGRFRDVPYHRSRVGLNHLAFHTESREQVNELTDKLKQKGVSILYEEKHPYAGGSDHYAVYFEDPDCIKVEIVAP